MNEEYVFEELNHNKIKVVQGFFYNKVFNVHKNSYPLGGAELIRDNISPTFEKAIEMKQSRESKKNLLLVGKVQSGKTSNLEMFTALALDNGFNFVVIYGGYDNTLLKQTINRFKKTFGVENEQDDSRGPIIFGSDELIDIDEHILQDYLEEGIPVFIISIKKPMALNKINAVLKRINNENLCPFIIDDEGDQASLNTKKDKENDSSATYRAIVDMKKILNNPLYVAVTATPHANVFLDDFSELIPSQIRVIEPGRDYCGAEQYHLGEKSLIEIIEIDDLVLLADGKIPGSIKEAINHYILASAFLLNREIKKTDMIIHSFRENDLHSKIFEKVSLYIDDIENYFEHQEIHGWKSVYPGFEDTFTKYFSGEIREQISFEQLVENIKLVLKKKVHVNLKNSRGGASVSNKEKHQRYKIHVGGDLLQRGVTFPNLVTTYFTRWAKSSGNMDTNLQRARWFGYRKNILDVAKLFTSEDIAQEFVNLSLIESDLWEQFYAIQDGEMLIDDILIKADNTKQKPTRRNVVNIKPITFRNKWVNQQNLIFDRETLLKNNRKIESFVANHEFIGTSVGRRDGQSNHTKFSRIESSEILSLFDEIDSIFDGSNLDKKVLVEEIKRYQTIPIILMSRFEEGRVRQFVDSNKILVLHQGADNSDISMANYLGDRQVVVDQSVINIQIHNVRPKKKVNGVEEIFDEHLQYVFSVYLPKTIKYYVRK